MNNEERIDDMKRLALLAIFALCSIIGFAQVDLKRLQETLKIDDVEMVYITVTTNNILSSSIEISEGKNIRDNLKVIRKNIKQARKHLSREQFDLYIKLIFTTIRNNELESGRHKTSRKVY